jgi:hypothetical protein
MWVVPRSIATPQGFPGHLVIFGAEDGEAEDLDEKDDKTGKRGEGSGIDLQEETASRPRIETSISLSGMN